MRLVVLESPYAGEVERNIAYAKRCVHDCLIRGEAAIASHLLYTQPGILDDTDLRERALGMEAGHVWIRRADAVVVYVDYGVSTGMSRGIDRAMNAGVPVERRSIGTNDGMPSPVSAFIDLLNLRNKTI